MRADLYNLATFDVTVAGVPVKVRRRTSELMLRIGDARRVFGLMTGAIRAAAIGNTEATDKLAEAAGEYVQMQKNAVPVILVEIAGEPVDPDNPPAWSEVAPIMDAVFEAFLTSGLNADPTPGSCTAQREPS